jgi:ribonuclease Z
LGVERLSFPVEVMELRGGETLDRGSYVVRAVKVDHRINALGYVVEEKTRPGRFDPDKARSLGVTPGPDFGRLQRGETLTLSSGATVKPSDVMGGARAGRKVVVSGDTRPCAALTAAAADADLLVHEATFSDEEQERALETRHSTAREAGRVAREAKAKRLILTHLSSRHDVDFAPLLVQARAEFKGPSEVAYDGLTVELPVAPDESVGSRKGPAITG